MWNEKIKTLGWIKRVILSSLCLALLGMAFFIEKAEAIPTLARKYKTTCMTCHATFPRLTALGQAVRLNGFKMPDGDETYIKEEVVSQGAEAYKRVFPEAVWPSSIPGPPPISIRALFDADWDIGSNVDQRRDNEVKLEIPHEVELLALGALGDNMSFFVEMEWEHPNKEYEFLDTEGNETSFLGTEEFAIDAWLMWEDILMPNAFNLKGGTVGMREIGPPNTTDHDRITRQHFLYHDADLVHDLDGPGIELNGFGRNWRYAVGLVKPQDTYADGAYYGQVALKFLGLGFDGSGGTQEEGGLKTTPTGYWRDDAIFLGGFFYKGDDNIDRFGGDVRGRWRDLTVEGGYVTINDDIANMDKEVWYGEVQYFVYPWLQPYFRYEILSDDRPNEDQARWLLGAAILARANVKFNVEGLIYTDNEPREIAGENKNLDNRILARLDFAF